MTDMQNSAENPRRQLLRLGAKLMGGLLVLAILGALFAGLFGGSGKPDVTIVSLVDLKRGEARLLEWQGRKLWLLRRNRAQLESLGELDRQVRDPYSKQKPLPRKVSYKHRGLVAEYLLVLAGGERCEVDYVGEGGRPGDAGWAGGFHDRCSGDWYDSAGRVYLTSRFADHLQVPDYRIVGASLIIGQPAIE